jgi:hypothetical protein
MSEFQLKKDWTEGDKTFKALVRPLEKEGFAAGVQVVNGQDSSPVMRLVVPPFKKEEAAVKAAVDALVSFCGATKRP